MCDKSSGCGKCDACPNKARKTRIENLHNAEIEYLMSAGWVPTSKGSDGLPIWVKEDDTEPVAEWDHDEALGHQKIKDGI